MAQIVKYVAGEGLNGGSAPQVRVSNAMGEAVEGLGRGIGSLAAIGRVANEKKRQKDEFKAAADKRRFDLNMARQLQERAESDAMPVDGSGFHDDYISNVYSPERDKFLAGLPSDELRQKYSVLLADDGPDREEWSIKAAERERDQTSKWALNTIGEGQNELATAISMDPAGYDRFLQQGFEEIEAAPALTTLQRQEQKAAWERMAQIAHLNRMLEIDPEGALKNLGADPRRLSPMTQFDILERAIIGVESSGDPNAVSPKGAAGLMQVMPRTAVEISKELGDGLLDEGMSDERIRQILSNETLNKRYGGHYLKKQIRDFAQQGGLEAALIAYNGGPERAKAWIKSGFDDSAIPKESADYYKKIMARLPGMTSKEPGDPKSVKINFRSPGDSIELSQDLQDRVKTSFASLGLKEVKVNSGHRTKEKNAAVGGAKNSQHIHGNAMDIDVTGYSTAERVQIIQTLSANGITGLGIGSNIIHADLGGRRAWGYKSSAGGGEVPKWAKEAIDAHLAGTSRAPPRGINSAAGRYASLPYDDRQKFIQQADSAVAARFGETSKQNAVQKVELRRAMANELASVRTTGQSTNFDDTQVATVLGEDDYVKWVQDRDTALRTYGAKDGIATMTLQEMNDRITDYKPDPGSPNFADDQKVSAAVEREVDRVTKMRSTRPDEAAMAYPDVRSAYDAVQEGMRNNNLQPEAVQTFVRATLERQKEFNLKPGGEAPVPRAWATEIGRSLARIPELAAKNRADVNAAITAQYLALQEVFGPYTEEVIMHALSEYGGVGPNTSALLTGYMKAIEAGGDPLRLNADSALDRDDVEPVSDDGWFTSIGRTISEFWSGERTPDEEDIDPGDPDLEPEPSNDVILRVVGALNGATPEDEADIAARYGQRAYEAAKRRIAGGQQ